jgi:hypothetical protein
METEQYKITKMRFTNPQTLIDRLKSTKQDFLLKKSSESTQIIYGDVLHYFPHSKNFPKNYLYMFKSVNSDVSKWLEGRRAIALPPKHDVSTFNVDYDFDDGEIIGTDLNHAYWRIAMIKGMISQDTYERGLKCPSKALRLATLSTLGRKKHFTKFEDGYMGERLCINDGDEQKRMIYKYIRYFCYQMMYEISVMLGDDFDCWRTDCIYYRNTPENVRLVSDYFDSKNVTYKNLTY